MDRYREQDSPDYTALAAFRYEIRRFLHFSEEAARNSGIEPQQHQLLLALKGLAPGKRPTITTLAERMQLQHHSAVELINRLARRGFVRRYRSRADKRQVYVRLTKNGEDILRQLSFHHLHEFKTTGPTLARALNTVISSAEASDSGGVSPTDGNENQRRVKS
jgi:DNA-binding MarR family transcriptional regulator